MDSNLYVAKIKKPYIRRIAIGLMAPASVLVIFAIGAISSAIMAVTETYKEYKRVW